MDSPSVRVLRNRVVESKDGVSTPTSKLNTPSKRGTPSKVASEASGITTRTRRRLSTKLENEIPADKLESHVIMSRLPELRTPSKRGDKNVGESDKSPVSQENVTTKSTRKDSKKDEMSLSGTKKGDQSVSSPQNKKVSFEDQSSPVTVKKAIGDLFSAEENGENSNNPQNSKEVLLKNQSSPKTDDKIKGDLPPILEIREDSDDSIIERSFQLDFNVTDKTKNELQNSPSKSPSVGKSPSKSSSIQKSPSKDSSIQKRPSYSPSVQKSPSKSLSVQKSPNKRNSLFDCPIETQVKKLVKSSTKSVRDLGNLEPLQSDKPDQDKVSGLECGPIALVDKVSNESINEEEANESVEQEEEAVESIQKEEITIESVEKKKLSNESIEQEEVTIESVEQDEGASETVDKARVLSKFVHKEDVQSNKSVDQKEETNKSRNQEESDKSIIQEKVPSEIANLQQESSETIEEESSETNFIESESMETIFIEKESNKSVNKSDESVCQGVCDTAVSTPNSMETTKNCSIINSSPSKKFAINSEGDSNDSDEIVDAVEEVMYLKVDESMNTSIENTSKINNVSFELVEKFQDTSAVNTLQNDDDTGNVSQSVPNQLGSKKLTDSSPLKETKSPKSSPSMVCSPGKHSSPRNISTVTSPLCQRLPGEKKSPSAAFKIINPFPDKLVPNKDVGEHISDSDSDSDDSDLPQEIPSTSISRKISPSSAGNEHSVIKSTPSPSKVLKMIKPNETIRVIQSEKIHKMKNLIKNSYYEIQSVSNAFNTQDESQNELSRESADLDELRLSRKELTIMMKKMMELMMKEAIDDALVGLRKDVLEMRKELSDLKTIKKKEEEDKAKFSTEENMNECSILKRSKELVVEQLLAKQAAQIFSDCDSSPKKKKSPKKNKESTQVAEESGSESCSTLPVIHQPKLKKRKMMKIVEEETEDCKNIEEEVEDDDNLISNAEGKKKRKRKRKPTTVEQTEETVIEPIQEMEERKCQDDLDSELKPKRKRGRKHKNKDKETPIVECTDLSQVNSTDVLGNLSKKSKKKNQSTNLFNENSQEDCRNVDNFDNEIISEKKNKKDAKQMDEVSSKISFSFNLDESEQPSSEGKKKKKKKKYVEQSDELNMQHSPENTLINNLDSDEFSQQSKNEAKKKKHLMQHSPENTLINNLDSNEFSQHSKDETKKKKKKHLEQTTSPSQNPAYGQLLKIKKQKLKKNLKPKSDFNISQQHLMSYMEEFCDFKPKDKVKLNSFEDGMNEVLKSKDAKKLKKKNKGSVKDSEIGTGAKDVKHSKKEAKDSSHKLTPSANLDVTNFWL